MRSDKMKNERGQSLVEFAVSLVMLLILLSVIVDGARALFTFLSMRDAAQEAASYASYKPTDTVGIVQRACTASDLMNDHCGDTSSCASSNPATCGDMVLSSTATGTGLCMATTSGGVANGITIDIQYPSFPLAMPFVGAFVGGQTVPISAQVTDTILSPNCP
jgi:Flp pilus assembly protein TadG